MYTKSEAVRFSSISLSMHFHRHEIEDQRNKTKKKQKKTGNDSHLFVTGAVVDNEIITNELARKDVHTRNIFQLWEMGSKIAFDWARTTETRLQSSTLAIGFLWKRCNYFFFFEFLLWRADRHWHCCTVLRITYASLNHFRQWPLTFLFFSFSYWCVCEIDGEHRCVGLHHWVLLLNFHALVQLVQAAHSFCWLSFHMAVKQC